MTIEKGRVSGRWWAKEPSPTGRLTNGPNIQNIPIRTKEGRAIRAAFLEQTEADNGVSEED